MLYFVIIIFTIYLTTRANLMYENLTGVASMQQYHYFVIIFTFFCACFFSYKMFKVYNIPPLRHKKSYQVIIIFTALIMSIGSLFPYTQNGKDFISQMHVLCSMFGCISFLTLLFLYTRQLSLYNTNVYLKIHWFFDLGLQFLCIFLIVFSRVNGYIEILYSILVCIYLYLIEINMK